jgi:hypothetical protein
LSGNSITVTSNTEANKFHPWWTTTEVIVFSAASKPREIRVEDKVVRDFRYDAKARSVTLTVPDATQNWTAQVSY